MPGLKTLVVVAGPTAIGKTVLAIQLARHFQTVIVSADSRQFFREMTIGTAKPSPEELSSARHYFIDSHSITDDFTVGDFEEQGLQLLDRLFKEKEVVVLAGGSGLYIDAITKGFDELPKAAPGIRQELNELFAEQGIDKLLSELQIVDPEYFETVDQSNPQRIIRALEVWRTTGKPISSFRRNQVKPRPFQIVYIGLNVPRDILYDRINTRVDQMIHTGLLEEVRSLLPYRHLNALNTVGYKEIFDYLDNKISLEEAINQVKQNTRRFAKRQLTWFRKNEVIRWFSPDQLPDILHYIEETRLKPAP